MNPLRKLDIPLTGLVGDTIRLGLAWIAKDIDREEDLQAEIVGDILNNALEELREKIKEGSSSKLGRNDQDSLGRVFTSWYGTLRSARYLDLFVETVEETVKLLYNGAIDPRESLFHIKGEKTETIFGEVYRGDYAILPAVLKQPEYYEYRSEYLKPSVGKKAKVKLSPLWLSILGLGFLTSFAGYRGGDYYLFTKPGIEEFYRDPKRTYDILRDLNLLTIAAMKSNAEIDSEEIYEMKLAIWLSKEGKRIEEEHFPYMLYHISLVGNVYTATKTLEIDLRELQDYMSKYVRNVAGLEEMGYKVIMNTKHQAGLYPLEALVDLAAREIRKGVEVSGDNEMLAYIIVKDLYRAISSGNKKIMEDTLFRIFRHARGLLEANSKANEWYKAVMRRFMWDIHLGALHI